MNIRFFMFAALIVSVFGIAAPASAEETILRDNDSDETYTVPEDTEDEDQTQKVPGHESFVWVFFKDAPLSIDLKAQDDLIIDDKLVEATDPARIHKAHKGRDAGESLRGGGFPPVDPTGSELPYKFQF